MKKILLYLFLLGLFATACQEDDLTPSMADTDRVAELLDTEKALIKKWYDNYNTAVLYEYNDTLDFKYQAGSQSGNSTWSGVSMPEIKSLFLNEDGQLPADSLAKYNEYVDKALVFLDTTLFAYIKTDSRIAKMMPPTLLISASLSSSKTISSPVHFKADYSVPSSEIYNFHALFNRHSMVFNVNQENLELDSDQNYMKDNFFLMICKLLDQNNLYDEFDTEIYRYSDPYFGVNIRDTYIEDYGEDREEWTDLTPNGRIKLDWFFSKGFVDAEGFYSGLLTSEYSHMETQKNINGKWVELADNESYTNRDENNQWIQQDGKYIKALTVDGELVYDEDGKYIVVENVSIYLPALTVNMEEDGTDDKVFMADRDEFIRCYINQVLYLGYEDLEAYPENIQISLRLTAQNLIEWGLDLEAFNPELEKFLNQE